jgi:hypothetical protein
VETISRTLSSRESSGRGPRDFRGRITLLPRRKKRALAASTASDVRPATKPTPTDALRPELGNRADRVWLIIEPSQDRSDTFTGAFPKFPNLRKGYMIAPVELANGSERHLGGRPTKTTPERENLLLLAIAKGLPLKAACKLAGLGFTTFNDWREEDSFFAQKIEFVEAQAIERNLALIQRAALKDWKAAGKW